uniref:CSON015458 protein n=1 Tax=Culicoides sonorensis TaxID=179676 RepID=A0A336KVJ3_CULSO
MYTRMEEVDSKPSKKTFKIEYHRPVRHRKRRKILEYNPSHTFGFYTKVKHHKDDPLLEIETIGPESHFAKPSSADNILNETVFRTISQSTVRYFKTVLRKPCAYLSDIWLLLTLVALLCACLSFSINEGIKESLRLRRYLLTISSHPAIQYCVWMMITIFPIWFATKFVQIVAPQSVGSGVPELKAIIRGVEVKDFLTIECLFAKIVGLLAVLGVGFPLGKEAAFIHIAAILAHLRSTKSSNKDAFTNELKQRDLLVSASAIGLASALVSPIGGFLFVIELNSIYFSIRHYWHGFYGSVFSVIIISFLYSWIYDIPNIMPYYSNKSRVEFSYDKEELLLYLVLGIICGLLGSLYVYIKKSFALFLKDNQVISTCIQKYCCPYSIFMAAVIATVTFPIGIGQYLAIEIDSHQQIEELFRNFTWTKENLTENEMKILQHWQVNGNSFISLCCFAAYTYFASIAASTMAIPGGLLIPVIKIGACFGRLFGEVVNLYCMPVLPGAFAIAGAAAFSGSVTHMVSMAIICFEITGHITHILPIMISVITSISIAFLLQLSLHDTMMLLKGLPYLPNLMTCGSKLQRIYVEDFMIKDVKYIWNNMTYHTLQKVLQKNPHIEQFPLVDPESMVLLGSVHRDELLNLIEGQIGREKRLSESDSWRRSVMKSPTSYGSFEKPNFSSTSRRYQRKIMSPDQKQRWRFQKLAERINYFNNNVIIDPAPFQLVEGTCLFQVHSLFVMVGIHLAYVTQVGELVGVVGLKELRAAIESARQNINGNEDENDESYEPNELRPHFV